ncbi:MAG: IS5 family transposase [Rickettsia endosymbiont of Culicoides impunctatus]|uniref:IS5 family transposase n=3 Tax=Rickettsieae TaxID=33988 RepID=UPI001E6FDA1F|nr:MAG: IS5 family transposase [Rickettsia endosymbiont of Culicoides impunctatus]
MPNKHQDPYRHKFARAKYKISNSREYDQSLKNRGSLIIWFSEEAVAKWNNPVSVHKKRGGQAIYSDLAIETCVMLGLVYKQHLRQTECFVESIIKLLHLELKTPDYTTISRRTKKLKVSRRRRPNRDPVTLCVDSTGIKIYGEQEWQEEKYALKARKSWRKLHIAFDENGYIASSELTTHNISDYATIGALLEEIDSPIDTVLADGAYDQPSTYKALIAHQNQHGNEIPIKAVVPPNLGFRAEMPDDSKLRLDNIRLMEQGRKRWQKHTNYGRRAKAENAIYRYKSIIGNKLKSRTFLNQKTESKVAANILNIMTKLGMPDTKKFA